MSKIGRNELCPCGSRAKYKNCYGAQSDTCSLFKKERKTKLEKEHKGKDQEVFDFFKEAVQEVGSVFLKNDNGQEFTSWRIQLIAVFTLIDVLASYWFKYEDKIDDTQQVRFKLWLQEFCLTEKNNEYIDSQFVNLSVDRLYDLRSSMVHFMALPDKKDGHTFALAENTLSQEKRIELENRLSTKTGLKVCFMQSKKFRDLINEGAIIMLEQWSKTIKESAGDEDKKWKHIEGINRVWEKIRTEGAVRVPKDNLPPILRTDTPSKSKD